ncbi:tail fiber domain-containing protein [Chryseobacterium sp.]|uniref:tail fiber domain-containing protein n=1 Tax=Chryseobacterium sp. TaxID=1871047 RepID=UPI0031E1C23B
MLDSGTVTSSDIRIKKDIVDNSYGLNEILKLRTINYRYKNVNLSKDKKVGFVAQEIKASMPELVSIANDEMKTL